MAQLPKVGETLTPEQFAALRAQHEQSPFNQPPAAKVASQIPKVGDTISAEEFEKLKGATEDAPQRRGDTLVSSTPSQIASGLGLGAAKSVGRMGMTTLQWLQNILGQNVSPTPVGLTPKTQIEQLGGNIGQIGVPLAAAALTGGASVPVQAAVGGLTSALAAASEGASPGATQFAGITGAAAPAIQAGSSQVVQSLRKGAGERVASAIGPSGMNEKEALSKVLDDITRQRPMAFSSEGLLKKFTKAADKANREFDAVLAKGPSLINTKMLTGKIDDVINKLKISGKFITPEDAATAAELKGIQGEIRSLASGPIPDAAKVTDLRKLKQRYDAIVTGVNNKNIMRTVAEGTRANAAQEGFFKIREGMIQQNPALEAAGRKAQLAITPRNILAKQEIRNISGGLGKVGTIVELGGLATTIATGRVEPAVAAATLAALRHIMASTPRKLLTANAMTTLANAIERGNVLQAVTIAAQQPAIVQKWHELQAQTVELSQ